MEWAPAVVVTDLKMLAWTVWSCWRVIMDLPQRIVVVMLTAQGVDRICRGGDAQGGVRLHPEAGGPGAAADDSAECGAAARV